MQASPSTCWKKYCHLSVWEWCWGLMLQPWTALSLPVSVTLCTKCLIKTKTTKEILLKQWIQEIHFQGPRPWKCNLLFRNNTARMIYFPQRCVVRLCKNFGDSGTQRRHLTPQQKSVCCVWYFALSLLNSRHCFFLVIFLLHCVSARLFSYYIFSFHGPGHKTKPPKS